jgi:branched-subunit amino acid ABC-type transport system permease component
MLEKLLFQSLIGLSFSMYLWLLAAGLTLVFGVLGVLNFAHGSLFMLGAYATFTFYGKLGLNFWLSIVLSLIGVGIVGAILERFFLRRIYEIDLAYQLILTFGFILVFDDLVKIAWGGVAMMPPMPRFFEGSISIFGRAFPIYNLFIIFAGLAVALILWLTLEKTWWGRMIRASASDREMANAIGINIPTLFQVFVSAMLAA